MSNERNQTSTTINTLDDSTLDDIYTAYLYSELEKSQEDIKNGRVMTIEESIERMRKKYANFNIK